MLRVEILDMCVYLMRYDLCDLIWDVWRWLLRAVFLRFRVVGDTYFVAWWLLGRRVSAPDRRGE